MSFFVFWLTILGPLLIGTGLSVWGFTDGSKTFALWLGFSGCLLLLIALALHVQIHILESAATTVLNAKESPSDSFAYVTPQPHDQYGNVPLAIRSVGKSPLSGVKLAIRNVSDGSSLDGPRKIINVGVMPADVVQLLDDIKLKAPNKPGDSAYIIEISEQNGMYTEFIKFRTKEIGGKLCVMDSLTVTKQQTISQTGKSSSPDDIKKLTVINQDWHAFYPCEDKSH